MRTLFIRGTDTSGVPADATEKPLGSFDRADPVAMQTEVQEMAGIAGIDGIAMGLRGERDAGFQYIPVFLSALEGYKGPYGHKPPTLMPFLDTGALRDIVNYDTSGPPIKFDFLNDQHVEWFWTRFLEPFYRIVKEGQIVPNPIRFERTEDGRLVILVWSIEPGLKTAVNQAHAQRVLDYAAAKMQAAGFGTPAFIVDQTWLVATGLNVYGVHRWFAPWVQEAWSVNTHNGVTVGVLVAGFNVPSQPTWIIPRNNGQTARNGLAAMRAAKAHYVFPESYNNWIEQAGWYRSPAWGADMALYLKMMREHLGLPPIPIDPDPDPVPIGGPMIAVSETPLARMVSLPVVPGSTPGTYAIRWNLAAKKPDPTAVDAEGRPTYFSIQKDGTIQVRTVIDKWESGKPEGDKLWFDADGEAYAVFAFRAPTS